MTPLCRRRRWSPLGLLLPLLVAAMTIPLAIQAQAARECLLDYESPSGNTRTNAQELPSKKYNVFQGGGVLYRCRGQDNTIIADSAEYYGDQSVLYLIGNVHYRENRAKVDSDRMTYYQLEDRLRAEGNVNAVLRSGTTMKGPVVDYYRVTPARPLARAVATGHPTMRLVQQTATGSAEPVDVVANQITSLGENLIYASGGVEITRPDIIAKGDSAFLDSQKEFARLMRTPSVQSRRDRPFTLSGGVIDLYSKNRVLERVVATPNGHALSQDLELVADSVDLRMSDDKIDRIMAWGKTGAHALSPERDVLADSIDAIMPDQHLREVRAVRHAYANSVPDTARFSSTERDWMRGDVIVAEFDSIAAADTTTKPQPHRIVATGNASSFYQVAGSDRKNRLPNINYVKGRTITVMFVDRAVTTVDVVDRASGIYIEPGVAGSTGTPVISTQPSNRQPATAAPTPKGQIKRAPR